MDIKEADKLINEMIKEDKNYTIKDYIEHRKDILSVSQAVYTKHEILLIRLGLLDKAS